MQRCLHPLYILMLASGVALAGGGGEEDKKTTTKTKKIQTVSVENHSTSTHHLKNTTPEKKLQSSKTDQIVHSTCTQSNSLSKINDTQSTDRTSPPTIEATTTTEITDITKKKRRNR